MLTLKVSFIVHVTGSCTNPLSVQLVCSAAAAVSFRLIDRLTDFSVTVADSRSGTFADCKCRVIFKHKVETKRPIANRQVGRHEAPRTYGAYSERTKSVTWYVPRKVRGELLLWVTNLYFRSRGPCKITKTNVKNNENRLP